MTEIPESDPEILLARAKAGQDADLGRLLELYRNYLKLLLRIQIGRRLQAKFDVEDVIQETFLEAHRGFSRFRGTTSREFVTWLRQIVAGILSNHLRHYYGTKRRDVRLERAIADELERSSQHLGMGLVAHESSPSQQVSRRETAVQLANALESLPDEYREVIILRQLEDLSFPEVAGKMGRSLHSVKHLWVRALGRLRRGMQEP